MRKYLIAPLIFVCCLTGHAEKTAPAPDFSAAFNEFVKLGLPALDSSAQWCANPADREFSYEFRELTQSLKGNAWLLPSPDGAVRILPIGSCEVFEQDAGQRTGLLGKTRPPKTFPDPTADITKLISMIDRAAKKLDPDDFRYRSQSSEFGRLLILATQLHQTGRTQLANQLAFSTFNLFPSREAAVDAAIDSMASRLYQTAADSLFRTGDWSAYHRSLNDLVTRFPRGWASRDAVRLMLPQLEKQAAGAQPGPPSLQDVPLDPAALKLIQQLTEAPSKSSPPGAEDSEMTEEMRIQIEMMSRYSQESSIPSSLWLVEDSSAEQNQGVVMNPAISGLVELKMAALPALAALTADPFFTHIPNPRSYSSFFSSNESPEDRILRSYNSLNRPLTRGELATKLLVVTLPDPNDDLDEADPESIRDLALSLWGEHKNSSPEELATVFLQDGSREQASAAAAILCASKDPAAHRLFEQHILESEEPLGSFRLVQNYLKTRRAAGRPFFDAYATLVRSQAENAADPDEYTQSSYMVREAGGIEKILKSLEGLVSEQSPRSLAVEIANGKPEDAEAAINSLNLLLADATPKKHLFALLEGANKAKDPTVRAYFITASFSVKWLSDDEEDEPDEEAEKEIPDRSIIPAEAALWRKFLADTRELPLKFQQYTRSAEAPTVSSIAALALEYSAAPQSYYPVYRASTITGKPALELFIERANARANAESVPPLPDASTVSPERLTAIVADAGQKEPAAVQPFLDSLPPDERAAWLDWISEPGELAIPTSVLQSHWILTCKAPVNAYTVKEDGDQLFALGTPLSPAMIEERVQSLAAEIAKHSRKLAFIYPADFAPGLQTGTLLAPIPEKSEDNDEDEKENEFPTASYFEGAISKLEGSPEASAVIITTLRLEQSNIETTWLVQDGKATLQASESAQDESLSAAIQTLVGSKEFSRFQINLQILTREDAQKITPSND